jgi:L-threonylcarbamoyladenylate synthase
MEELTRYIALLRASGVIACPTETQMGLLCDARDARAVARVCAMKRRPASEPIALLVPSFELALELASDARGAAEQLARGHWPGPLTLVMRARAGLPSELVKDDKVALRMPGPSPALEIVRAFGGPLTATSANRSGEPPLERAEDLIATFGSDLAAVVPGQVPGGLPSTIVDVTGPSLRVLRQGPIALPA